MKRILIVDDETVSNMLLSLELESAGYDVRSATNGNEAMETALQFRPEILITDWLLKWGPDGVELARMLLQEFPHLRVIFFTGMAIDIIRDAAEDISRKDILIKPVDSSAVLSLIQKQALSEDGAQTAHP